MYFRREGIPEGGKMRLPIPDTTDPPTSDLIAGTHYSLSLICALSTPTLVYNLFSDGLARGLDLVATTCQCHVSLTARSPRGTGAGLIACATAMAAAFLSMGLAFAATTD